MIKSKKESRNKIRFAIRKKVLGTSNRPRLAIFRSNKEIYAQLIDDVAGNTLASASSRDKSLDGKKITKTEKATEVGKLIALNGVQRKYNQEDTLITPGLIAGDIKAVDKTFNILTEKN